MSAVSAAGLTTEISSGFGQAVSVYNTLIGIFINVSAFQSPENDATLDFYLQESPNGIDWYTIPGTNTASSITGTGLISIPIEANTLVEDTVRIVWTIGGTTPSFTFTVNIETVAL